MGEGHVRDQLGIGAKDRRGKDHDGLGMKLVGLGEGALQPGDRRHLDHRYRDLQQLAGGLHRRELGGAGRRIPEHHDVQQRRQRLLQELQPFHAEVGKVREHAGDVAAGSGKARHEPAADRIALEIVRDNGQRRGGGLGGGDGRGAYGQDDVDLAVDEAGGKRRQLRRIAFGRPDHDLDALGVGVVHRRHAFAQGDDARRRHGGDTRIEKADPCRLAGRLAQRSQRPEQRRAAGGGNDPSSCDVSCQAATPSSPADTPGWPYR